MSGQSPDSRRAYNRFCPLSLALDQVGDRWALHIVYHLLSGPKRYSELWAYLAGAGKTTLSDRLRSLSENKIISRIAGPAPGSEICYQLTERGLQLAPVVAALNTWGLDILIGGAPGGADDDEVTFDQEWTIGDPGILPSETY